MDCLMGVVAQIDERSSRIHPRGSTPLRASRRAVISDIMRRTARRAKASFFAEVLGPFKAAREPPLVEGRTRRRVASVRALPPA